ncbi:bifunctional glutamate N-acetyltransferase/amino-acid acetyltransferase ArgJ [Salisediminibacterium beveridgei]|nr:bifunctional glutamate N-acetyltransferase/amino-acid acetyltransferase ArgJ [Salisediminibacterium beveridgei]
MTTTDQQSITLLEKGHITSPKGFQAGGVHCGLRKTKLDFGWIHSDVPADAAGVYTLNAFRAAPLHVTKEAIDSNGKLQTIITNSAVANSCTGPLGEENAKDMQMLAAKKLQVHPFDVAVLSTGVIGVQLPMDEIKAGIQAMDQSVNYGPERFEQAILTTDTVTKHTAVSCVIDGKTITVGGAAKGSGMIHPNMATMLAYMTTDANVEQESLQTLLSDVTNDTYNMITVDGDSSTNDTVLLLANGAQKNEALNEKHPDWPLFKEAVRTVSETLAKKIAQDGEGATKLVAVHVLNAQSKSSARKVAKAVISSNLVKTAVYGADPNWGRIVCAVGYSEEPVDPNTVHVKLGETVVVDEGLPVAFDEDASKVYLGNDQVDITVDLNQGTESACAWGCDLTYQYVKINASYRT